MTQTIRPQFGQRLSSANLPIEDRFFVKILSKGFYSRFIVSHGMHVLLVFLLLIKAPQIGLAQLPDSIEKTWKSRLESLHKDPAQQKVYLHLDKKTYFVGEQIWYKAYVVQALNHRLIDFPENLFVELLNHQNQIVSVQVLKVLEGEAHGNILLPDSLPNDVYTLRAYTHAMVQMDSRYWFSRELLINNPGENQYIRRAQARRNRRLNMGNQKLKETYEVNVYAEGGSVIQGVNTRFVVRLRNHLGQPIAARGQLVDSQNNLLQTFMLDQFGLADFQLKPDLGQAYYVEIFGPNQQILRSAIPEAFSHGYAMQVLSEDDTFKVNIRADNRFTHANDTELFLLAHTRGVLMYFERINQMKESYSSLVPNDYLKPGISVISLVSSDGSLFAERLVYRRPQVHNGLHVKAENLSRNDSIWVKMTLQMDSATSYQGNLSLSFSQMPRMEKMDFANIETFFYLTSDLPVQVPFADYLLQPNNGLILDRLLIASKWERYSTSNVIQQPKTPIVYHPPQGLSISGIVKPRASNLAINATNLQVIIGSGLQRQSYAIKTDPQGRFTLSGLNFEGMAKVEIIPGADIRGRQLVVELDEYQDNMVSYNTGIGFASVKTEERSSQWQRVRAPRVFVPRRSTQRVPENVSPYGTPDYVLYISDLGGQHYYMADVLKSRVPGVSLQGNKVIMRGPSSLMMSNEPLFFIDNTLVNSGTFLNLNVQDLERIEIISGAHSAIFGARGANGAIMAFTKRGDQTLGQSFEYLIAGYLIPADFNLYMRGFSNPYSERSDFVRTLYWNPSLRFNANNEVSFLLPQATSNQGDFVLVLEGIDKKGQIVHQRLLIKSTE